MKTKQNLLILATLASSVFGGILIFKNISLRGQLKNAEKENIKLGYKINNLIYQLGKNQTNITKL